MASTRSSKQQATTTQRQLNESGQPLPRRGDRRRARLACIGEPEAFLSFGAGVQSTALWLLIRDSPEAVMTVMGRLPKIAVFADTGAEPDEVYRHMHALESLGGGLPILRVSKDGPSLAEVVEKQLGTRFLPIPAFTRGQGGERGMLRRQCTREYKIQPIQAAIRRSLGFLPRRAIPANSAESWIGISTDEAGRCKESGVKWIRNRYPLLELGLSRDDCREIIKKAGLEPTKSRCYFCPYISDWAKFRADHPDAFEKAVRADSAIRDSTRAGVNNPVFLAPSLRPLAEHVLPEKGPLEAAWEAWEDQGFEGECDGICGL